MRAHLTLAVLALPLLAASAVARDMSYLKSKPYDQLTAAELSAAKEEAKKLKLAKLVACADPGNMPLSNDKLEGFQNKIAKVVGEKLGTDITFFWRPYLERGLTRDTFDNNECQVLIDMPADYSGILMTQPIYRTGYVLAYREDSGLDIKSINDPRLQSLRVGVFQHSALRAALADRGMKEKLDVQVITSDADLRPENQPWRQVQRVVDREIDVAGVWGPFAGWLKKKGAPLVVKPVNMDANDQPLEFSLAWGVQNTDVVLKLKIDMALDEAKSEIAAILNDYGVPLLTCSNCVVEGNLPSLGTLEKARAEAYEKRFTATREDVKLSDKASADQVVTREKLQKWLAEGANVQDELFNAISAGDADRTAFLIEHKADVNKRDGLGHLPLGLAASMRKTHIMEVLLKAGAHVDAADGDDMTALHHAINANHVPSIELLAKNGANIEKGTKAGYTALELAIADGKFFAAKALLEAGARVDTVSGPEQLTPLMVIATMLQPQQRLNQISKGPTPLILAEELINRKVDVNARSKNGVTALMIAAGHNNAPMIGLLLRAGADPKIKAENGKTALAIAIEAQNEAAVGALKFLAGNASRADGAEGAASQ